MSKKPQISKNNIVTIVPSGVPPHVPFPSKYEGDVPALKGLYGEMVKTDVKPDHFTDEDLKRWVRECRGSRPNDNLSIDAMCYWMGYFYPLYTPEGREMAERLSQLT